MVTKTRERFIEVARQLFARKGVENTTMNDIASASDKGRRTIYTYFKNKSDIFNAVVDSESDRLLGRLRKILVSQASPTEKVREYVHCRLETMRETESRTPSLRLRLFTDMRKAERARRLVSRQEIVILEEILHEGVEKGVFDLRDVRKVAVLISHTIQGLDMQYVKESLLEKGMDLATSEAMVCHILLHGILAEK